MRRILCLILLILFTTGWTPARSAQPGLLPETGTRFQAGAGEEDSPIHLRGVTLHPGKDMPALPGRLRQDDPGKEGLWIIQFYGPPRSEWLDEMLASGLEVVSYLPENAYLVWGSRPPAKAAGLSTRGKKVRWHGAYHPYYRLSQDLRDPAASSDQGSLVDVTVQIYTGGRAATSLDRLVALAEPLLADPTRVGSLTNVRVRLPVKSLAEVSAWPDVVNIETYTAPRLLDEIQGQILAGNVAAGSILAPSGSGYLGWLASLGFPTDPQAYPVVDVVDDGLDSGEATAILHPDFYQAGQIGLPDRVSFINNCTYDYLGDGAGGHGNLNAGIVAGYNDLAGFPYQDSAGYQLGLGISPYGRVAATKIFANNGFFDLSRCGGSYTNLVSAAYASGARITSNSWGTAVSGQYDADAQEYDFLTRDASIAPGNQEMLHIFAAGNAGPSGGTITSPATGKNILAVGATENVRDQGVLDGCYISYADNAGDIAGFSSRGPAKDGRAKPDIVAPGTHVQGPANQGNFEGSAVCGGFGSKYYPAGQSLYTWSSGTSHSTPAISGVAQLAYTYYRQVLNPAADPSPAMLKALILNTPRYLTGLSAAGSLPGPAQGWGMADMGSMFDGTPRILVDQSQVFTEAGQSYSVSGLVSDPDKPFHVSLVWTDAPGSTISAVAAVNNLDLEVTAGGKTYLGNVFDGSLSATGGTADALNNVENVFLPAGVEGPFTVRVIARGIPGDAIPGDARLTDQDFALVIYNASEVPMPVLAVHDVAWSEYAGNGNAQIDPGETIDVTVTLENVGSAAAQDIQAGLVSGSPQVHVLNGPVIYPDIPSAQLQPSPQAFRLEIATTMPCAGDLPIDLHLIYNAGEQTFPLLNLAIGALFEHAYSPAGLPAAIPDYNGGVEGKVQVSLPVNHMYSIVDLDVGVNLTHTYDSDLTLQLTGPEGDTRTLSDRNGGSGNNYGTDAEYTLFDDEAARSIIDGDAPFSGRYRPQNPLSIFDDRPVSGDWVLTVLDKAGGDTGYVRDFALHITERRCAAYSPLFYTQVSGGETFLRLTAGETIPVQIQVTNTGGSTDTLDVQVTGSWASGSPSTVGPLDPGESRLVNLSITAPAGAPPGTLDQVTICFISQSDPSTQIEITLTIQVVYRIWFPYFSSP